MTPDAREPAAPAAEDAPIPPALNPLHPLAARLVSLRPLSSRFLFRAELHLQRYPWAVLLLMFALVLPPLEQSLWTGVPVRLITMIYPFFFVWALTRAVGVDLLQMMLDGHWTETLLAAPIENPDWAVGLKDMQWTIVRRYWLMAFFSLALYGLETGAPAYDAAGRLRLDDVFFRTWFAEVLYFTAIGWMLFVFMARLWIEVRLRSGLLKGLGGAALLATGAALLLLYGALLFVRPLAASSPVVLSALMLPMGLLWVGAAAVSARLARHFRRYLRGQLDLDVWIFDDLDVRATAWTRPSPARSE